MPAGTPTVAPSIRDVGRLGWRVVRLMIYEHTVMYPMPPICTSSSITICPARLYAEPMSTVERPVVDSADAAVNRLSTKAMSWR